MRLGQFARKYDIRVQDIISYLENESEEAIHSNTKLSDESEAEILDFFGIEAEEEIEVIEPPVAVIDAPIAAETEKDESIDEEKVVVDEDAWIDDDEPVIVEAVKETPKEEKKEAAEPRPTPRIAQTPEEDIALAEGEFELYQPKVEEQAIEIDEPEEEIVTKKVPPKPAKEEKPKPKEDEVIDTDRLMELLESEEEIPELDKIKLIKASKKELSGLKVLGKVDLPEPKKKEEKEENQAEESQSNKKQQPKKTDDDWEARRLVAKAKREKNEARVAKQKKEKEERERIARNATHYKQKLATVPPKKKKSKAKKQEQAPEKATIISESIQSKKSTTQKEQPKSIAGKMWKWLTNPD